MARHNIQIPINKSSNDSTLVVGSGTPMQVPTISDSLYLGTNAGFGVGWDNSLFPQDKKIISVKLYIYAQSSYSQYDTRAKFAEFSEGSSIPTATPPDKTIPSFSSGWNIIELSEVTMNGLVFKTSGSGPLPPNLVYTTFNSHRASSNKPYLLVTYDDIPPEAPTSLYPSGITVSTRDVIRFSWLHNSKENLQQKGFTLQYSTNGGNSWTTVTQTTPNQFYDMPANTLPTSGTVMWKVMTKDDNDEASPYTSASFTLGVVPQKAPIPISPISQYMDENKPIRFEWSFLGGSQGEIQSKFELQYSINGGNTWSTRTVTTQNTFYELAANTLAAGNIVWRVRTYNNWNEVSPYSENRSFTVIGSPPIPQIISVTNKSRPTINWQATGQHIYEIQILKDNKIILDTGSIPSVSDRSFKLENYLEDGNYLVKLRILNEYNLYSPWAEKSFTISTIKPPKPIIDVYSSEYTITINTSNTSLKTLVYREGVLLGEVINNNFTDYTGENRREYKYFVRTLDSNENFRDSDIKLAKCSFSGNTLALNETPNQFIKLKHGLNGIPGKSITIGTLGTLQYFYGRTYPVAEYTEFRSLEKTLSFFMKNKEEVLDLIKLIDKKKTLLYRDVDGENIVGSIFNITYNKIILGYEVGFTITKTEV